MATPTDDDRGWVARLLIGLAIAIVVVLVLEVVAATFIDDDATDGVGELVGNWSWPVWLLVPGMLVLALITALCLGSWGEPTRTRGETGGVSRYLARTAREERDR